MCILKRDVCDLYLLLILRKYFASSRLSRITRQKKDERKRLEH